MKNLEWEKRFFRLSSSYLFKKIVSKMNYNQQLMNPIFTSRIFYECISLFSTLSLIEKRLNDKRTFGGVFSSLRISMATIFLCMCRWIVFDNRRTRIENGFFDANVNAHQLQINSSITIISQPEILLSPITKWKLHCCRFVGHTHFVEISSFMHFNQSIHFDENSTS